MTFATNDVYEAPVTGALLGEDVKTEMDADERANGFVGTEVICADHLNFEIDDARGLAADWGDGADGALHITGGGFTLTRDHSFTTVSFGAGHSGHIETGGWKLRVKHLDLRNAQAGAIQCNGNPGAAVVAGSGKGFDASLPPGKPGARNGVPADSVNVVLAGVGGRGGGYGGGSGVVSAPAAGRRINLPAPGPIWASLGGSSGSKIEVGDDAAGGGGGGGYLYVRAAKITYDATTEAGALSANGGAGETGKTNADGNGLGGGGGGGGGCADIHAGGVVGMGATKIIHANGGDGGDGGESTVGGENDGDGAWGGSGGLIMLRIGASRAMLLGDGGGSGELGVIGTPGAGGAGGGCEAALSTAPGLAGIFGVEAAVDLHADDTPEADGVAVTAWAGRSIYSATGVNSPLADADGYDGTRKAIRTTAVGAYIAIHAAAAAYSGSRSPLVWLLACNIDAHTAARNLVSLGSTTVNFNYHFLSVAATTDGAQVVGRETTPSTVTGSAITESVPSIIGMLYDGANLSVLQRTSGGDAVLIDNVAHTWTASASSPFDTFALGALVRANVTLNTSMAVRCFKAFPEVGAGLTQEDLIAAMDYVQIHEDCPV